MKNEKKSYKNNSRKSGFFSKLAFRIVFYIICFSFVFVAASFLWKNFTKVEFEKKHALVERQLTQCAELTLYKVHYSDVVTLKKRSGLGFAKSYSIVRYTGVIRSGIQDIMDAKIDLSSDGKDLLVTLPPTVILGNDITTQSVYDEDRSIFVPITVQEVFDAIAEAKEDAASEMVAEGLMDETDRRAKLIVKQMLLPLGFRSVIIK